MNFQSAAVILYLSRILSIDVSEQYRVEFMIYRTYHNGFCQKLVIVQKLWLITLEPLGCSTFSQEIFHSGIFFRINLFLFFPLSKFDLLTCFYQFRFLAIE